MPAVGHFDLAMCFKWLLNLVCLSVLLAVIAFGFARQTVLAKHVAANWTGNFSPCERHSELLKRDTMSLGVRISTSNLELAKQFESALSFWATVVDMAWYEDETTSCAVQLVEATPSILKSPIVARAQLAELANFQGWIAFDSHAPLTKGEMYVIAVHEIGHMLGLRHNPNTNSVMYYFNVMGPQVLDRSDLWQLSFRHKLRFASIDAPVVVPENQLGD